MKSNRRSFLKRASGLVVAAVAAPLYIPAERLAFGVPRPPAALSEWAFTEHGLFAPGSGGSMLDRTVFAAPERAIIQPFAYTYSLYAGDRKIAEMRSPDVLSDVTFHATDTATVNSVAVEFADGRPPFTERIRGGITLMDGDSLTLKFNETWQ